MSRGGLIDRAQDPSAGGTSPLSVGLHAAAHVNGVTGTYVDPPLGFASPIIVNGAGDYTLNYAAGYDIDPSKCVVLIAFDVSPIVIGASVAALTNVQVLTANTAGASVDTIFYIIVLRTAV